MPDAADDQDSAPFDELDRELRELTEGRAGEPLFLEPSAAERALAGAVRVQEAPASPAGRQARARRRRRGQRLAPVLAVITLLVAGGLAWLRVEHPPGAADSGAQLTDSAAGPVILTPVDLFDAAPNDPFLGSDANGWANGAAGIVAPPAARPVGGFTAGQVAAAYATTRQLLIAAGLDKQTLLGGQPAALARLLTGAQRTAFLAGLHARGVAKDGRPLSTRSWVASFAPGTAELVGTVIKVRGTMRAVAITESGRPVLRVEVSYEFAYAVRPPADPADWTHVTARAYGSVDFARWNDQGGALEPLDRTVIEPVSGVACGAVPADGYLYPGYPSEQSTQAGQARQVIGPYKAGAGTLSDRGAGGAACAGALSPPPPGQPVVKDTSSSVAATLAVPASLVTTWSLTGPTFGASQVLTWTFAVTPAIAIFSVTSTTVAW